MKNRNIINELKELMNLRGKVTKAQLEYARAEERGIMQMHPLKKPHEEVRHSDQRTLDRYIDDNALRMLIHGKGNPWD